MKQPRRGVSEWCCIIQCELSHWSSFSRVNATTLVPHIAPRSTSYIPSLCCSCTEPTSASLCKLLLYLKVYYVEYQKEATSTENILTLMLIFAPSRPIKLAWPTGIVEAFMPDHSRCNGIFHTHISSPLTPPGTYHLYHKNRSSTRRLESNLLGISSSRRFTRMFHPCPFGIKTTFQPQ